MGRDEMSYAVMTGESLEWAVDSDPTDPSMPPKGTRGKVVNDMPGSQEFVVTWENGLTTTECDLDDNLWRYVPEEEI
jgi:hypothetical protein